MSLVRLDQRLLNTLFTTAAINGKLSTEPHHIKQVARVRGPRLALTPLCFQLLPMELGGNTMRRSKPIRFGDISRSTANSSTRLQLL